MAAVSAVIPAFREAELVGETVGALRRLRGVAEVLVVDDASPDDTARAAERAGARVLRLPRRTGKAGAVAHGVRQASGDVLLLLDADLGESAAHAGRLLAPVLAEDADLAVAVLPPAAARGGFGLARRRAAAGIRALTGRHVDAPLSGQRALRREVLEAVGDLGAGWELEVRMTVRALWAGYRLVEVPVPFRHRAGGRDLAGFWHRGGQYLAVERALFRLVRERTS